MTTATLTDNATIVGKLYEAFGRGDIPFILDHIDDNCRWTSPGEGLLPQGGIYTGKEVAIFFQKLNEHEEFHDFTVHGIHNLPNNEVVAFGHASVTVRNTGKSMATDWVMHWKMNNDGKVIYFQDFFDSALAYAAYQS